MNLKAIGIKKNIKKPLDIQGVLCYNKDSEREVIQMKYYVDYGIYYEEFDTYREAEIFCGENELPCEEIYEDTDWESFCKKVKENS